ncbi:MAG TPA: ribulose-phosphate 3-epimerase [Chitinophagales bacterium]|nr:ribulose-phosphate 3-epimerase [Chitinophagales bacterium]HMW12852.1 ribulose-phosphate 3-epimerase [Chitinophagales bacterium]HMX60463.1 ribulose-phosphate 3-epimerase [Chitinophagales bacterium]HMY24536.1 ribulose-phosphate 3-epimerase [Chitinophagales bacterium]HMZ34112.1 ribulose-phosphate 3-epimerase [Chitinophagales bacterium]
MNKPIIAPSILSANFANLSTDFEMLHRSAAEYIHVDVMDGVFVPNISLGLPVIQAMRKLTTKTFDVHLMIVEPDKYIDNFKQAGADILTVHVEACTHLHRTVQNIHSVDMRAGVAINPHTPIHLLEDIINDIDLVCIMSVNPGFGGQKFIENTYTKVAALKELIQKKNATALIEIDGGVSLQNAKKLVEVGANVLVAGNTVFNSENPEQTIQLLKNIV